MPNKIAILLLLPIILSLAAAESNSHLFLTATSITSLITYLYVLYEILELGQAYRFFMIASISCAVWVTLGFLQSAYYMMSLGITSFTDLFPSWSLWVPIDVRDYALAFAYLYSFVFASALISRTPLLQNLESTYFTRIICRLSRVSLSTWSLILAIVSAILFAISFLNLFAIRGLASQFASDAGVGRLPWWFPVVLFIRLLLPLLVARVLVSARSIFSLPVGIGLLGLLSGLYFAALSGRSAIIALIVSTIYCWWIFERPSDGLRRIGAFRLTVLLILSPILIPFFVTLINFTFYLRYQALGTVDPFVLISAFFEFLNADQVVEDIGASMTANLVSRPLVLWPLAASIKMSILGLNEGYIFFQDIWNSLLFSIPRPLYPDKENLSLMEGLLYTYFPFSNVDTADSPYLFSFASFGLYGLFVYPIFMATVYALFLGLVSYASNRTNPVLYGIITLPTLAGFAILSYGEMTTAEFIRNFAVPSIFVILLKLISLVVLPSAKKSAIAPPSLG